MKFSEFFFRIGDFEKRPFFFSLNCLILTKICHKLCDRMNGTQFWCFPWFPANSLLSEMLDVSVRSVQLESTCFNLTSNFSKFKFENKLYLSFTCQILATTLPFTNSLIILLKFFKRVTHARWHANT